MKRWALVVLALYSLILVVLTAPVCLLAFAPKAGITDVAEMYLSWAYWVWLGVVKLTLGITVMLFSFWPAVFFLYVERWRRLHPQASSEADQPA